MTRRLFDQVGFVARSTLRSGRLRDQRRDADDAMTTMTSRQRRRDDNATTTPRRRRDSDDFAIRSSLRSGRPSDHFDFAISDATPRRRDDDYADDNAATTRRRRRLELSARSVFNRDFRSNRRRIQPSDRTASQATCYMRPSLGCSGTQCENLFSVTWLVFFWILINLDIFRTGLNGRSACSVKIG